MAALAIAKRTPQGADLHLEVRFLDEGLGPGARYEFVLADHLACSLDEDGQDVEGAATEPYWLVAVEQKPLCRK
jgi:hypothetical protein